jgi:hypothetical protein
MRASTAYSSRSADIHTIYAHLPTYRVDQHPPHSRPQRNTPTERRQHRGNRARTIEGVTYTVISLMNRYPLLRKADFPKPVKNLHPMSHGVPNPGTSANAKDPSPTPHTPIPPTITSFRPYFSTIYPAGMFPSSFDNPKADYESEFHRRYVQCTDQQRHAGYDDTHRSSCEQEAQTDPPHPGIEPLAKGDYTCAIGGLVHVHSLGDGGIHCVAAPLLCPSLAH